MVIRFMTSNIHFCYFLLANTFLALLYFVVRTVRRKGGGETVFFLFLPGLGFVIYSLTLVSERFRARSGYNEDSVLIRARFIEHLPEHPDVRDELNVMAVADAVAASDKAEKRAFLLKQLKGGLKESYKILMLAEQDDDTESAHYIAAAKMEIRRINQQRWAECRREYEKEPENADKYHAACAALEDMIGSGVISARAADTCRRQLCDIVEKQIDADERVVSLREYEEYLGALAESGRYEDAERLWNEKADKIRTENTYMRMLKMFYCANEWEKFEKCLSDMRGDSRVYFSVRGMEQIRYWEGRSVRSLLAAGETEIIDRL